MTTLLRTLPGLFRERLDALLPEVTGTRFVATSGSGYACREADNRITSPYAFCSARGGPQARRASASAEVIAATSGLAGGPVTCHTATYLLYDEGQYVGCHTDRAGCDVNLLVLLAGGPCSVALSTSEVHRPVAEVLRMAQRGEGFLVGTEDVPLEAPGDAVAFRATIVPHQRRPVASPLLLLSLCFD